MMSLLWHDGFDMSGSGAGAGSTYLTAAGYTGSGNADTATGRQGSGIALKDVAGVKKISVTSIASGTAIIVGMAVKATANTDEQLGFQLENGDAVMVTLYLDRTNRRVKVYRGTSAGTLLGSGTSNSWTVDTYFYLEMKVVVHDTTGTVDVRINGASVLSLSGQDTKNHSNGEVTLVGFQFNVGEIDDFYICDGSGSSPRNNFLGNVFSVALAPTADSELVQWTESTGTTHWDLLDEQGSDGDSTYVESAAGSTERFRVQHANIPTTATVFGLTLRSYIRDTEDLSSVCRHIGNATSDFTASGDFTLTATYAVYNTLYEQDPIATDEWTPTAVNGLSSGLEAHSLG